MDISLFESFWMWVCSVEGSLALRGDCKGDKAAHSLMHTLLSALTAVSSVVGATTSSINSTGVGTGERAFPPQVGITFTAWIYIEQFSSSIEDPHPVRILSLGRQLKQVDGSVKSIPCLTISISAKDCTLVVSCMTLSLVP